MQHASEYMRPRRNYPVDSRSDLTVIGTLRALDLTKVSMQLGRWEITTPELEAIQQDNDATDHFLAGIDEAETRHIQSHGQPGDGCSACTR